MTDAFSTLAAAAALPDHAAFLPLKGTTARLSMTVADGLTEFGAAYQRASIETAARAVLQGWRLGSDRAEFIVNCCWYVAPVSAATAAIATAALARVPAAERELRG